MSAHQQFDEDEAVIEFDETIEWVPGSTRESVAQMVGSTKTYLGNLVIVSDAELIEDKDGKRVSLTLRKAPPRVG